MKLDRVLICPHCQADYEHANECGCAEPIIERTITIGPGKFEFTPTGALNLETGELHLWKYKERDNQN